MRATLVVFAGLLGLAVGSFLTVVVSRVPEGLSIVAPRSRCDHCHARLRSIDLIPVVSYLSSRGKCRYCGAPIGPSALVLELVTTIVFVLTTWRIGVRAELPAYLVLDAGLLALAVIDYQHYRLPTRIVYSVIFAEVLWFAAVALAKGHEHAFVVSVASAAVWSGFYYAIHLASPRAMGFGDVRLALATGLGLGWLGVGEVIIGFFLANVLGVAVGLVWMATGRLRDDHAVPYGVFLAAGTILTVILGPWLLAPFSSIRL